MGWTELDNGSLLKAAATDFDGLITTDQNLRHQQNLKSAVQAKAIDDISARPGSDNA